MRMLPAETTTAESFIVVDLLAAFNGTAVMTTGPGATTYNLPDITGNTFTTVFEAVFTFENIGIIDVFTIFSQFSWLTKGNGTSQFQISGDGGNTWVTMLSLGFNNAGLTLNQAGTAGTWLSSINAGPNQLHVRLQNLANAGTVSSQIQNLTQLLVSYRKKDVA